MTNQDKKSPAQPQRTPGAPASNWEAGGSGSVKTAGLGWSVFGGSEIPWPNIDAGMPAQGSPPPWTGVLWWCFVPADSRAGLPSAVQRPIKNTPCLV